MININEILNKWLILKYMAHMEKFFKMHGLGNDFVIFDGRQGISMSSEVAQKIANRRTGVGCDQIIIIDNPINDGDVSLKFFNSDGSISSACGNGTRCVADLIFSQTEKEIIKIDTSAGQLSAWKDKDYNRITVDMGAPEFLWDQIPLSKKVDYRQVDLGSLAPSKAFCLSMGNPHAIFFLENQETFDLEKFGGEIENHDIFPEKANISLVSILSFNEIRVKVWERGVGITSACGSAACAASVASYQMRKIGNECDVLMDGGKLHVMIKKNGNVFLSGPTEKSFEGYLSHNLEFLLKKMDDVNK